MEIMGTLSARSGSSCDPARPTGDPFSEERTPVSL